MFAGHVEAGWIHTDLLGVVLATVVGQVPGQAEVPSHCGRDRRTVRYCPIEANLNVESPGGTQEATAGLPVAYCDCTDGTGKSNWACVAPRTGQGK